MEGLQTELNALWGIAGIGLLLSFACIIWMGAAIRRLQDDRVTHEQWLKGVSRLQKDAEERLARIEGWERWIVKLQKQIKEYEKSRIGNYCSNMNRIHALETQLNKAREVVQYLMPIATGFHQAHNAALKEDLEKAKARSATRQSVYPSPPYVTKKHEALEPTWEKWEKLTSRPVHPMGSSACTGIV